MLKRSTSRSISRFSGDFSNSEKNRECGRLGGYIMLKIELGGVELSFRGVARCVVSFRSNGGSFFFGG